MVAAAALDSDMVAEVVTAAAAEADLAVEAHMAEEAHMAVEVDLGAAPSAKPASPASAVDAFKEKIPILSSPARSLSTFLQLKPTMVLYSSQTAIPCY